ncbi:MAG TPA: glycosyltransferase family 4 protein [Chloroflexaceae bacterium]|nr:glycosyltransferase family 4 protein [Chloroflexaceae bacterium]
MNILLLTNGIPYPPDSGPRVKTYQLIRYLATRHSVTLVSLGHDARELERAAALAPFCAAVHIVPATSSPWRSLRGAFGPLPRSVSRHESEALRALLARLVAEAAARGAPFDLVHADQLAMAPYAEALPLPRLLDAHNALWTIKAREAEGRRWPLSLPARLEAARLRAYEGRVCAGFDAVTAVSEEDRAALLAAGPARELTVIPIGIDGDALAPVRRAPEARAVLSLAAPGWPPNAEGIAWFAREVYPLVRRAVPDSHLYICGAQPAPELRALAEATPAIDVTGFVNPGPFLEQAAALIAPLRSSGGMRVMLPEALARGVPVVATSLACAGLDVVPGEHLLVADTPSAFADAVALLLRDHDLGERIGAAARRHALDRYDWRATCPAIDGVYARITATGAPRSDETQAPATAPL